MKTITMPTNIDPVYIDINGEHYEFRAGQSYEVSDSVACVVENVINNQPKTSDSYSTNTVVDFGGKKLRNVGSPSADSDAVNKGYLDNRLSGKESLPNKVSSVSGSETSTTKYPSVKAMTDYVDSVIDKNIRFTIASLSGKASAAIIQTSSTKLTLRAGFVKDAFTFSLTGDDAWSLKTFEIEDQTLSASDFDTLMSQMEGYDSLSISRNINQGLVYIDREYSFDTAEHASAVYEELGGGSVFTAFTIKLENAPTEEAVLKGE